MTSVFGRLNRLDTRTHRHFYLSNAIDQFSNKENDLAFFVVYKSELNQVYFSCVGLREQA